MKFYVEVTRTSYTRQTIEIEATSAAEAKRLVLHQTSDAEFSTYHCEYEVSSVEPAKRDPR